MKSEKELLDILNINQNRLDEDWNNQSKLIFQYSCQAADARRELEEANRELKVAQAEMGLRIRESPADFGLEKATEGSINQVLETRLTDHYQTIAKKRHNLDVLQAMVEALQHRKHGLENTVKLFMVGYMGEPKTDKEAKTEMESNGRKRTFDRCKIKQEKRK